MSDGSFSERARLEITGRSWGSCQRCGGPGPVQCHHRRPRGKGGTSEARAGYPSNGIALCRPCHDWVESHRAQALDLGLLVRQGADPAEVPVWLLLPYGRHWYRLLDTGDVEWAHDVPDPS